MRSGGLLGLIAWQIMLADCVPMIKQRYDEIPRSLSNIELLIPLVMSDASDESDPRAAGERYERAHLDKDMPFSNIPSSAFVLDQPPSSSHPSSSHKHKRGHKHSRKQDLMSAPRFAARFAYLENEVSDESKEPDERNELGELARDMWGACSRLMRAQARHQHELLLVLCSELLDVVPIPPPAPPAAPLPSAPLPDCPCCAQAAPLLLEPAMRARREFMPIGGNSYWVQNYMKAPRKRPHRPDLGQE